MQISCRSPLWAAVFLMLAVTHGSAWGAEANVFYVTDELRLGLYADEDTTGRPKRTLISGARLQLLDRALRTMRVRTDDGDEGWVKSTYLTEAEPARRRIKPLEELTKTLEARLAAADQSAQSAVAAQAALEARVAELSTELADLPDVQAENERLKNALARDGVSVRVYWLAVVAVIAAALGGVAGHVLLDRRVRKRFGGMRPY